MQLREVAHRSGIKPASLQTRIKRFVKSHPDKITERGLNPAEIPHGLNADLPPALLVLLGIDLNGPKENPPIPPKQNPPNPRTKKAGGVWAWLGEHAISLPMPLLGIPASFGVYRFARSFAPEWVAVVEAGAFELTYICLAFVGALNKEFRRRAFYISLAAMVISGVYNWLAGPLHHHPDLYRELAISTDTTEQILYWLLAGIHGVPPVVILFYVAELSIHRK